MRPGSAYGPAARFGMTSPSPALAGWGRDPHVLAWQLLAFAREGRACLRCRAGADGGIAAIVEFDLKPGTRLGMIVAQIRRAVTWLAGRTPALGPIPRGSPSAAIRRARIWRPSLARASRAAADHRAQSRRDTPLPRSGRPPAPAVPAHGHRFGDTAPAGAKPNDRRAGP